MLGAIIGDLVGSRFEWNNIKTKDFDFLTYKCFVTDDSIMTLALAKAILESAPDYSNLSQKSVEYMQSIGRNYPDCGYGIAFSDTAADSFVRCHRSYIVGVRYIKSLSKTDITLDNGTKLPLSRSNYQSVHQAFIRYFKGESTWDFGVRRCLPVI